MQMNRVLLPINDDPGQEGRLIAARAMRPGHSRAEVF